MKPWQTRRLVGRAPHQGGSDAPSVENEREGNNGGANGRGSEPPAVADRPLSDVRALADELFGGAHGGRIIALLESIDAKLGRISAMLGAGR